MLIIVWEYRAAQPVLAAGQVLAWPTAGSAPPPAKRFRGPKGADSRAQEEEELLEEQRRWHRDREEEDLLLLWLDR